MVLNAPALYAAIAGIASGVACGIAKSSIVCPSGMIVWSVDAMHRVGLENEPSDAKDIRLSAARGEFEAAQVIVRACGAPLKNVTVAVSDFTSESGDVVSSSHATLYRERYVHVARSSPDTNGSNRPLGTGWYPDGLIPFRDPAGNPLPAATPFNVDADHNQPVWVDIFVPRDAAPGQYRGVVSVTSSGGAAQAPVNLTVRKFTLPFSPTLKTSFGMHEPLRSDPRAQELLLEHKIMPTDVAFSEAPGFIDRLGLTTAALRLPGGANRTRCTMTDPPAPGQIADMAKAYPSNLLLYVYPADEIDQCANIFDTLRAWSRNVHQAAPRIKVLVTVTPTPVLLDDGSGTGRSAVNIWVLLPIMYDKAGAYVAQAMKKGDEIWSYAALVQDSYSPKWEIDFDPINYRIQPGFLSASLGLTGLLYWRVDLWSSDPWNEVGGYSLGRSIYPGEGMLVYPGDAIGYPGIVPSMRLKYIREGIEDYEYVQLAMAASRGNAALQIAESVGADWSHWSRHPAVLEKARNQLGDLLDASQLDETQERNRVRYHRIH